MRSTLGAIPCTHKLLKDTHLPLSIHVQPFAALRNESEPVPVVKDGAITRCRRCRAFINPFVSFIGHSQSRWRCNLCHLVNDVSLSFNWDPIAQKSILAEKRPEMASCVVEYVATAEYVLNPPSPLVYLFLVDVSYASRSCGLVAAVAATIREHIRTISNPDGRTRIGFIAFDTTLTYFYIPKDTAQKETLQMLVVSDINEEYIPLPSNLTCSLSESPASVDQLLDSLSSMFDHNSTSTTSVGSALGPALQAALQILVPTGGKVVVLTAARPNVGVGNIRLDSKNMSEASVRPTNTYYKSLAVECCKRQVSVDMFLFPGANEHLDIASLSTLPRYTAGQTYVYRGWMGSNSSDVVKFATEFGRYLTAEPGRSAVFRLRLSTGLRAVGFYGNLFKRSSDVCSLPWLPRDQSYMVEVELQDDLPEAASHVYFQSSFYYTTVYGQCRLRVLTLALPVTKKIAEVYAFVDQVALMTHFARVSSTEALDGNAEFANKQIYRRLVQILQSFRRTLSSVRPSHGGLHVPFSMRHFPMLLLSLAKSPGLSEAKMAPDDRVAALYKLLTIPPDLLLRYIYPAIYSLHTMTLDSNEVFQMPERLNHASITQMVAYGLYLIDNGQDQVLWVGQDAVPLLLSDVFGVSNIRELEQGKRLLPEPNTALNHKIRRLMDYLADINARGMASIIAPTVHIVVNAKIHAMLVEDAGSTRVSLNSWLQSLAKDSVI